MTCKNTQRRNIRNHSEKMEKSVAIIGDCHVFYFENTHSNGYYETETTFIGLSEKGLPV